MDKTILVTGGTGYVGSWIVQGLLAKGYRVRITARDKTKSERYTYLIDFANGSPGELEVFEADLLNPGSYNNAAQGSDAIIHVASPFTLRSKDPLKELIEPAVHGTENVLNAASASTTVKKIVLTSSVVAVYGDNLDMHEKKLSEFIEDDFNDTSSERHQPYSYSKVKAELAAWSLARAQEQWQLVVMNPAFVMGPPLSANTNSESIKFIKDMVSGKMLIGAPHLEMGYVDVRDVATAHILALENEITEGRHILAERVIDMMSLSRIIKASFPGKYPLPLIQAPKFMLYLTGWAFGLTIKFITRNVGHKLILNNSKSVRKLGLTYTPLETTIKDMIEKMQSLKLIKS